MDYNSSIQYWYMDKDLDSSDIKVVFKMYLIQTGRNIIISILSDLEAIIEELGKQFL